MEDGILQKNRIVGLKESIKAVESDLAKKAFIAKDADTKLTSKFVLCCQEHNVELLEIETMQELGQNCGIEVSAAVAVLLK